MKITVRNYMRKIQLLLITLLLSGTVLAEESALETKVNAALQADVRTDSERQRDANRKPLDTLEFFGIKPDMKVLELIPGGGWYTKILAPTLREQGQLYVAIGTTGVKEKLLSQAGFDKIKVLEPEVEIGKSDQPRLRTINQFDLGEKGFDAVLTFRNMHNFDAAGRKNINDAVFKALKSGGIYGVVDHTRRHMEPFNSENRRRVDPVAIIKELIDAGFEFVDYSDIHYKADDELRFEVGRKTVTGNTDRFTLLFRKPK